MDKGKTREKRQVVCDPADHKKWGGACAATCIKIVHNVVRARSIQGGLRPPCTPLLLRLHSPCHSIPCLKLFACQWCVRPPMYTSTAVCSQVSEPALKLYLMCLMCLLPSLLCCCKRCWRVGIGRLASTTLNDTTTEKKG